MDWRDRLDQMVDQLLAGDFVSSPRVEGAFRALPRHHFVPGEPLDGVYRADRAIVTRVEDGVPVSSSSAPDIMGVMLEQLGVEPGDRVLEVGAGTGYNAALLAMLAAPSGSVTSIDIDPAITAAARSRLLGAGFGPVAAERAGSDAAPVAVVEGDGWLGWPDGASYDRIEVSVGVWDLSPHWLGQLREGGTLVVPLWLRGGTEALVAFERRGALLVSRTVDCCGFMRLRGPHAGPERLLRVDGWRSVLEGATDEDLELLAALLRLPAIEEGMDGELPEGWFARLSLEEPDAIVLFRLDERGALQGLYDRATRGLALVGDGRIRVHGGDGALRRLRDRLPELRRDPLDLRRLHVEAIPTASPGAGGEAAPATEAALVLHRPSFDLVIREGGAEASA